MKYVLILCLAMAVVVLVGCASNKAALPDKDEPNQIVDIIIDNDSDSMVLYIQANQLLNYTEDRMTNPTGIVFSFPDTKIDSIRGLYTPPENEVIRYIRADAHAVNESPVTTIYIALKADTPYGVTQNNDSLQVTFPRQPAISNKIAPPEKPAEVKPEPQSTKPAIQSVPIATALRTVNTEAFENSVAVNIEADGKIKKYKAFRVINPDRIVFDLYGIKSPYYKEQKIAVQSKWIKRIRYFGHPDKLRLVIETLNSSGSKYSSVSTDTGLIISVGAK